MKNDDDDIQLEFDFVKDTQKFFTPDPIVVLENYTRELEFKIEDLEARLHELTEAANTATMEYLQTYTTSGSIGKAIAELVRVLDEQKRD